MKILLEIDMKEASVVTSFLCYENRICLLRRSQKVGTYQGRWAGVSGYLEDEPLAQAKTEILEETGLVDTDFELVRQTDPVPVIDEENQRKWLIYPFLFRVKNPDRIQLDWEHIELKWIIPEEMKDYPTVPGLWEVFQRVWREG